MTSSSHRAVTGPVCRGGACARGDACVDETCGGLSPGRAIADEILVVKSSWTLLGGDGWCCGAVVPLGVGEADKACGEAPEGEGRVEAGAWSMSKHDSCVAEDSRAQRLCVNGRRWQASFVVSATPRDSGFVQRVRQSCDPNPANWHKRTITRMNKD